LASLLSRNSCSTDGVTPASPDAANLSFVIYVLIENLEHVLFRCLLTSPLMELWGRFIWWLAQGQNASAVQAICTAVALPIAIGVPAWQHHTARTLDSKRQKEQLANLRTAL
jgi:hypothetical protein